MFSEALFLLSLALGLSPAHPFGRSSLDQSLFVQVAADELRLTLELDIAETLSAELLRAVDSEGDGEVSAAERRVWLDSLGRDLSRDIVVRVVPLSASGAQPRRAELKRVAHEQPRLRFPPGEDALPTVWIEFAFRASLALTAGERAQVEVCNQAFATLPGLQTTEVLSQPAAPGRARGASVAPSAQELTRCVHFELPGASPGLEPERSSAEAAFGWVSLLAGLALILLGFRALFGAPRRGARGGEVWRQRGLGLILIVVGGFVASQALQELGLLRIL